ncbi:pyridoxamine 5'-phosphate oxidase family protein [Streptomyces sp. JJ38]|uniref:pyridoxamine 5'-phosphate oxidase family protein n=1 Tax=Streptomyces sp. JJ38 TaxID=2738128 RepID=UPI0027D89A5E|nr:pyridoxamine 5'-phosphate oxidase family protein [Streptomyces sp. JJ38]
MGAHDVEERGDSGGRPGSAGEHEIQAQLGSERRADRFYADHMLDHLNERMREFASRQEMFFLSTADRDGNCDSTFRAGPQGFLQVLDERTLAYPEYRGNGVHASLGNIRENPHLGILLIDFIRARIGLHINGSAEILEDADIRAEYPHLPEDPVPGRRAELWVRVTVDEAYIHCAKHIPHLQHAPKRTRREWGTDDHKRKGGDFFGTARDRAEREGGRSPRSGHRPAGGTSPRPTTPGPVSAAPAPAPAPAPASAPGPVSGPREPGGVPAPAPVPSAETFPPPPLVPPPGGAVPPPPEHPPVPAQPAAGPSEPVSPVPPGPAPLSDPLTVPDADALSEAGVPPEAVKSPGAAEPSGQLASLAASRAWQERAERLLAEAHARRDEKDRASYAEWFSPPRS